MVPAALSVTVAGTFAAAPAARRLKVAVVIVAAFMGLLNVAVTVVLSGTLIAPFGGAWAVDGKRAAEGKRVDLGGPRVIQKKTGTVPGTVAGEAVIFPHAGVGGWGAR